MASMTVKQFNTLSEANHKAEEIISNIRIVHLSCQQSEEDSRYSLYVIFDSYFYF